MLYTTRGIIIHQVHYSESSLIVKIFTEKFGLKSYIFRGVYKPRSKFRAILLQHLNLIELVSENRDYGGLQHPKELRLEYPYISIASDIRKSSICLFVNEMLYHSIKHEESDPQLFDFLRNSLIWLDKTNEDFVNFHLWLCIHLTDNLGFSPHAPEGDENYFNLRDGVFQFFPTASTELIPPACIPYFKALLFSQLEQLPIINIPHNIRNQLINHIIYYYKWHITDFGEIHSHIILSDILS